MKNTSKRLTIKILLSDSEYRDKNKLEYAITDILKDIVVGRDVVSKKGSYKIDDAECVYVSQHSSPTEDFYSVNIHLKDYDSHDWFLYYDELFEKNLQKITNIFDIGFSESGMQGKDYINLDVNWSIK